MRTIKRGDVGHDVAQWQRVIGTTDDGVFGAQTELGTKAWQLQHGLTVDGIVGPKTWGSVPGAPTEIPPLPPLVRGCDVSAVQGDLDDACWAAMAAQNIEWAYMRLMVGNETWVDGKAKVHAQRAKAHGILPGYYGFVYPLPHLRPADQIERFVRLIERIGIDPDTLPPLMDLEWPPPEDWLKWGCTEVQLQDWGLVALERAKELTGVQFPVYSYPWWIKMAKLVRATEYGSYPLLLANYNYMGRWPSPEEIDRMVVPGPWSKEALLGVQHDGNGGLKLPNGRDADFDVMPGGPAALAKWTAGAVLKPAATVPQGDDTPPTSVAIAAREGARTLMLEDMIAEYRRTRHDEAA